MDRSFYYNSIKSFCEEDKDKFIGKMNNAQQSLFSSVDHSQNSTWNYEFDYLKKELQSIDGQIIFEFSIPRLGKRIDTVLLIKGVIFVIEFKVGADAFLRGDIEQVWDYALDLKNFHEGSHNATIIPILIATNASEASSKTTISQYNDSVLEPLCINGNGLKSIISTCINQFQQNNISLSNWAISRYSPTPTIIQAASSLYLKHSVEDITRSEASGKELNNTTNYILNIIKKSKERKEKSICFVTGVPGAGKTLVGLNVAIKQFESEDENGNKNLAVYLSGNGPLVDVLTEALARDKQRQEQNNNHKCKITDARREVKTFIQIVHHYRNNTLNKIKLPIKNDTLEIDPTKNIKNSHDDYSEVEHVAIFDEAQRAWRKDNLANWLKQKKGIDDFPLSEPEFLIWSLDLKPDWACIVCLVGGGQEINTGEAGIKEWINAINKSFPNWKIYISDKLTDKEYAEGNINTLLSESKHYETVSSLHLGVSMRSFRAEKLSLFVHHLLDLKVQDAKLTFDEIKTKYPIVITRDIKKAKNWLTSQARGSERYGIVVSSQAYRLRPLALDVRCKPDTVHWFLDDIDDIRSSLFLEDFATEFDIQGLELDWSCLVWDADFRKTDNHWDNFSFTGSRWHNIAKPERKMYQKNAYRVLLTRARQGMVICVPEGDENDSTRRPEFYNGTYNYLKSIGIPELL